jgi:hypothetical protein
VQTSAASHKFTAARHSVDAGANASAGQTGPEPGQRSATSHRPLVRRHTCVLGAKPSVGHAAVEPVHASATSQSPALMRHTEVLATKPSTGQTTADPSQASATSQPPAGARHCVPALTRVSPGQLGSAPSHVSATSQLPADALQTNPAFTTTSAGHVVLEPLQTSATSQLEIAARQTVLALSVRQVPSTSAPEEMAQASQAPPHAELQHTPSTQKLLVQSVAAVQLLPFGAPPTAGTIRSGTASLKMPLTLTDTQYQPRESVFGSVTVTLVAENEVTVAYAMDGLPARSSCTSGWFVGELCVEPDEASGPPVNRVPERFKVPPATAFGRPEASVGFHAGETP